MTAEESLEDSLRHGSPSVVLLFPGIGMRVNGAPLGYCSTTLIRPLSGEVIIVDPGVHQTREVVLANLENEGLTPDDVDTLVLSHLHFDHVENAPLFPQAQLVVHAQEIQEAREHPDRDRYVSDYVEALLVPDRTHVMETSEYSLAAGVTALHLPGHRHGMLVVVVETDRGTVVCSSDAARNARELLEGQSVLSDPDMAMASQQAVKRILSLADVVVPGHDRLMRIVDGRPVWDSHSELAWTIY
jgi:glyoxylase-like metal-dependent hydrolase (beta-lactamase superfamily II)